MVLQELLALMDHLVEYVLIKEEMLEPVSLNQSACDSDGTAYNCVNVNYRMMCDVYTL